MCIGVHLITWSLLIWSSTLALKNEDWVNLLPDMTTLCPNVDVCGNNLSPPIVGGPEANTVHNSCCRGCSCDVNCSKSRDCCDGEGDIAALSECLKPSTEQELEMNTYSFITKPPVEGCRLLKGQNIGQGYERNATCSPGVIVDSWKSFPPVYSRSLDKNFKNEACARCHGADDIEEWKAVLYTFNSDLVLALANLYEENILLYSYIVFNPPNMESKTSEKLCFEPSDTCPEEIMETFFIPKDINMDRESIIKACKHGPVAKYFWKRGKVLRNVFCALCNGLWVEYVKGLRCRHTLDGNGIVPAYVRVSIDDYQKNKREFDIQQKVKGDCYRPKYSKNKSVCETLYCPSLQTRLKSGNCGFAAKFATIENFILCLNVSTDNGRDNFTVQIPRHRIHELFEENSPWTKEWLIFSISARLDGKPRGSEFLVCLKLKTNQINLETLNTDIKTKLSQTWEINLSPKVYFEQSITKHGITFLDNFNMDVTARWPPFTWDLSIKVNLTEPHWTNLYDAGLVLHPAVYYDRTYLCEQIELRPDEYYLKHHHGALYLTKQERFLYPNQFTLLFDDVGPRRIRVCLSDSDYVKVVSGTGTMQSKFKFVPVVALYVWMKLV